MQTEIFTQYHLMHLESGGAVTVLVRGSEVVPGKGFGARGQNWSISRGESKVNWSAYREELLECLKRRSSSRNFVFRFAENCRGEWAPPEYAAAV